MVTKSRIQTQKLAANFAKKISKIRFELHQRATIVALCGELGSGKTTFVQGFIKALGVKQHVTSPTFVIIRRYKIFKIYQNVYHLDLYRIRKSKELLDLGFKRIIRDPQNIVLIEWPEKIKKLLPKNTTWISFEHGKKENNRRIEIKK